MAISDNEKKVDAIVNDIFIGKYGNTKIFNELILNYWSCPRDLAKFVVRTLVYNRCERYEWKKKEKFYLNAILFLGISHLIRTFW